MGKFYTYGSKTMYWLYFILTVLLLINFENTKKWQDEFRDVIQQGCVWAVVEELVSNKNKDKKDEVQKS